MEWPHELQQLCNAHNIKRTENITVIGPNTYNKPLQLLLTPIAQLETHTQQHVEKEDFPLLLPGDQRT